MERPDTQGSGSTRPAERPKTRPKQAMIRPDQQTSLDELARELHDARSVKGERITANTVLRVAIDGVVAHGDRLHGDNEDQLRESWLEFLSRDAIAGPLESELAELACGLGDGRKRRGEPVTSSVLVRVAAAGLAAHGNELHGSTEEELLDSWLGFLSERRSSATGSR